MNKRITREGNQRGLTVSEGCAYTGLGISSFKRFADLAGARMRFGRSVRYDRVKLDAAMDRLAGVEDKAGE